MTTRCGVLCLLTAAALLANACGLAGVGDGADAASPAGNVDAASPNPDGGGNSSDATAVTPDAAVAPTPDAAVVSTPDAAVAPTPDAAAVPTPDAAAVPTPDATVVPTPDATVVPTPDAGPPGPEVCFVDEWNFSQRYCYPACGNHGGCTPDTLCRTTPAGDVCVPDCRAVGCAPGMTCQADTGNCAYPAELPGRACASTDDCANCCNWTLIPGEGIGDPGMWAPSAAARRPVMPASHCRA